LLILLSQVNSAVLWCTNPACIYAVTPDVRAKILFVFYRESLETFVRRYNKTQLTVPLDYQNLIQDPFQDQMFFCCEPVLLRLSSQMCAAKPEYLFRAAIGIKSQSRSYTGRITSPGRDWTA